MGPSGPSPAAACGPSVACRSHVSVARSPPWGGCGEVCAGQPGAGRAPALGPGGGFWLKARFPVTFYFETIAGMLSSGESGDTCVPALAALCSLPVRASVRGSRLAHGRGPVRGLTLSRARRLPVAAWRLRRSAECLVGTRRYSLGSPFRYQRFDYLILCSCHTNSQKTFLTKDL